MNRRGSVFAIFVALSMALLTLSPLVAQEAQATLSGAVTDAAGKAVPNAKVTVKNSATGQVIVAVADAAGKYAMPNLAAGDYEVSVASDGGAATANVTLAAGAPHTLDLSVVPAGAPEGLPSAPTPNEPAQNAPTQGAAGQKQEPSLEDLGFSKSETQSNAAQQALLDRRTHMLKIHQRMGLITTIPMVASVVTSFGAGGRSTGTASRDLHVALGAVTGDLYGITAWYAIRAPRIAGTETRGPIKVHKALAWVHGTGMILTPILGAMAFSQKNNGEKVHGIAQAHGPVAIVTAGAFGAALLTVSVKF